MPALDPDLYIFVDADGIARELHASERQYLATDFHGSDGGRPYIKFGYSQRDGWGEISGYMERSLLPEGISVHGAPAEDPHKPQSKAETIASLRSGGVFEMLRNEGWEVVENSDGSVTMSKSGHSFNL